MQILRFAQDDSKKIVGHERGPAEDRALWAEKSGAEKPHPQLRRMMHPEAGGRKPGGTRRQARPYDVKSPTRDCGVRLGGGTPGNENADPSLRSG